VHKLTLRLPDNLNSWSSTKGVHSQDQSTVKGLSFAIKLNDLAFCKRVVVEAGVQIPKHLNICGGCNPILVALDNNNLEIAHYLAQCGASTAGQLCSMSKHRGYSAVHLASRHPSNNELLKLLLEKDLEVGSPSFQSPVNPIHVAASYKNAIGLRTLLQHAYDQRWISKSKSQQERLNQSEAILTTNHQLIRKETFYPFWGSHSLCDARMYNSHSKWIWELGSFKARDVQNLTALHISAWLNDNESIGILLDYGAAVDPLDGGYQTPMMAAALCRHLDIVKLLLQHGANPNMIRRDCRNIAIMAVQVGHVEMLKTLVSHGISLTHCDQWGGSVLHYAGRHCPEAFSLLLASGCDPYQRDIDGYTPIEVAIRWRTVRPLCLNSNLDFNRGIIHIGDIGTSLERGYTPLSIMKLLFKRLPASRISREINAIPSRGFLKETMLVTAARRGDQQALDFLIKMGAELELEGSSFGTPLLAACNRGVLSSVRYLIRRGANIFSCKNGEEQSAVQAAKLFPEIIQWLLAERHTEQPKLCWLPAASTEQELSSWSGPMTVEVPIDGLYSPTGGASSFERAKDLAELRKYLQGRVVRLHSNAW
jgi:ankyrin repeat protein